MAWLAVLGAVVPAVHLYQNRAQPGAMYLLALCVVMAVYPLDVVFLNGLPAVLHSYSSIGLVPPLLLLSVLSYLRLSLAKQRFFVAGIWIYMVFVASMPWVTGSWFLEYAVEQPFAQMNHYLYELGPGAWLFKAMSYVQVAVAVAVVVFCVGSSRVPHSFVLSLAVFPFLAVVFDLVAALTNFTPHYGITTLQIATTVGLFVLSFALLRRQMLERVPVSRNLLVKHMREGMCVIAENGEIASCNDAMAAIINRSSDRLIGRLASRVLPESLLEQIDEHRRKGDVSDIEVQLGMDERVVSVSVSHLDVDAGGPATLLAVTDVTQQSQQLQSVEAAAGELREANEYLSLLSNTDELTGLGNRRLLQEALTARLDEEESGSTGLIMVDIDHFKVINDTHGHLAGDAVLIKLAEAMRATCRDNDLIVRWGGEEFVALLGDSDEQRLQLAAERLRLHIRRLVIALDNGVALQVTASIGATLVRPGQSPESALRQVDRLLYEAKIEGRDRVKSSLRRES